MTTAAPFRLAIVGVDHPHGAGWRESLSHLPGEIEIVALVPRFGGSVTSLEERYAHLPRFATVEELLAWDHFSGALVCLPNDEAPVAITALAQAGIHILAEKPIAGSAQAFAPVAQAIDQADVAFQTGYLWRYDECANRLKEMVSEGRFGKLISVEMAYVTADVRRRGPEHYLFDQAVSGRGFFNWLACHWLDLVTYITGQPITAVTARVGTFGVSEVPVEDGGVAICELAGGGLATFLGGYWLPRWTGETQWNFRGSERWVHWHPTRHNTSGVLEIHGPQPQFLAMNEVFTLPADPTPGYGGQRMLHLVRDWLTVVHGGRNECRNTPASTLATLELLDAIYKSSAEGRRVPLTTPPLSPPRGEG